MHRDEVTTDRKADDDPTGHRCARLLATATHELRTPLLGLLGFLDLMGDALDTDTDADTDTARAEVWELLEAARRNGRRLQALVDDLLTLAEFEAGAAPRPFEPVDVSLVVRRVGETMGVVAREAGVELMVGHDERAGWVDGDAEQLERVLLNLVDNAVKYTPRGGSVRVATGGGSPHQVVVDVADSGVGIPLAEQEQIFAPFVRTTTARRSDVVGHGLGLSIVAEIVDSHRGSIAVCSAPGKGSTFTIVLPRLPQPTDG